MRLEQILIGLVVFALIIVFGVMMNTDLNNSYNLTMGQENKFNDTYSTANKVFNDTYEDSQNMKDSILFNENDAETTEDSMFKGAFKSMRFFKNMASLVGDFTSDIAKALSIPDIFVKATLTIFAIFLGASFLYLVLRFRPS